MIAPSLQQDDDDSLYCNPTEDGGSLKTAPSVKSMKSSASSSSSVRSGTQSTKSKSTTRSKSSTSSIPKSESWKAAVDPLGMSTKSIGAGGFMPMFNTHLYSPGFQTVAKAKSTDNPKAFQNKQLKFVEKKKGSVASSAASTKSGKSSKSTSSSGKSIELSSTPTKSSFISALAGSLTSQGQGSDSPPEKRDGKKLEDTKPEERLEEAAKITISDKLPVQDVDKLETGAAKTENLLVVVEDHSLRDNIGRNNEKLNSIAMELSRRPSIAGHNNEKLNSIVMDTSRRPSIAESIMQLQPRSPNGQSEILLKRVISWEYLGKVYDRKTGYYNTIFLCELDFHRFYTPELVQKRTYHYFLLGISIANTLDIPGVSDYAKALNAVLHEYEDYISSETKSKMSFFKGYRKVVDYRPFDEASDFSHFEVRSVPFDMDYTVIFVTLCDMIAQAYKKFDTHKASIIVESDVFHKIDVRFKKILNAATKELEVLAREAIHEELMFLNPTIGVTGVSADWEQQVVGIGH
ncbi:hypothetical protein BGZ76_010938 [Entomortierella beljakovae]|nr:hypothetical protein BGZ76_010938 [Entomortierella beljakovae]